MTRQQKLEQVKEQLTDLLLREKLDLYKVAEKLLNSGAISPESEFLQDNFLLSKLLMTTISEKYTSRMYKKEVDNIKKFI